MGPNIDRCISGTSIYKNEMKSDTDDNSVNATRNCLASAVVVSQQKLVKQEIAPIVQF